jgi:hypothetical protein
MARHAVLTALVLAVAAACSGASETEDAGADAGRDGAVSDGAVSDGGIDAARDAGPDAHAFEDGGDCPRSCEATCARPNVCVLDSRGCRSCAPCPRCDPLRCETACVSEAAGGECGCAGVPPLREGERCGWTRPPCEAGLECVDGLCYRPCASDAQCEGPFPECRDGRCDLRRGSEWGACSLEGECDEGLECTAQGCRRPCDGDADCTETYPRCVEVTGERQCSPVAGCDAVRDAGCGPGLVCRLALTGASAAEGVCLVPAALVPSGARCEREVGGVCVPGHDCIAGRDGHRCYRLCYTDESVEGCGRCAALTASGGPLTHQGRELGVCL